MTPTTHDPETVAPVNISELCCQVPDGVLAARADPIRLSWKVVPASPGLAQEAYEIEASDRPGFERITATSGVVEGAEQVAVADPGPSLASREVRFYRVRIRTGQGWAAWGEPLRVEAGLLAAEDWEAQAITLPDDPGRAIMSPSPVLRRRFELGVGIVSARLYVTSLGLYRLRVNGAEVGDSPLAPGWTAYRSRLVADTHDVTSLLRSGANVVVATLGDGWHRGRLGWNPGEDRCHYGKDVALLAQLEVTYANGTVERIVTDEEWSAATAEIRAADFYDGSTIDLRERLEGLDQPGYDTSGWQPAAIVPIDTDSIEPRMAEPVRVVETFPIDPLPARADDVLRLDAGQNIAGYLRLTVRGSRDDEVVVRHAEVLEPDGSLHTRSLRSAKATDRYVLADEQVTVLEPAFTFHGFRHAEVRTNAEVLGAEFVAISSDTPRRGRFECAHPALSRFHESVVWSQRDNFVSVPTDCPQRDERLGWTGDAQAFGPTACTLFESRAFWSSWLIDLALDQDPDLGVPSVVPDVVLEGEARFGRAGWADAATIVPWAVYESYGDIEVLRRQYDSMVGHVDSLRLRMGVDGLLPESFQFGDWLDPDAPASQPWASKADSRFLANAFFAHSARLLSRAAALLGHAEDASTYADIAQRQAELTWTTWAGHAATTQTGSAVALCFELAPEQERASLAASLAGQVRAVGGRVATGFLGTPLVLPALAGAGYWDEAYLMLLRNDPPSWLYQVGKGATTVWERWDAILPDGSIHSGAMEPLPGEPDPSDEGHMLSFNHYAYGAMIDWVYRHVAGLASDAAAPGYRHVILAPRPVLGLEWARASVESPYGTVSTSWRIEDGSLVATIGLPFGTSGTFVAPVTPASTVHLDGEVTDASVELGPGEHTIVVDAPMVADPTGSGSTEA